MKQKLLNRVQTYFYVRPSTTKGRPGTLYVRITANSSKLTCSVPQIRLNAKDFDKRGQVVRMSCAIHSQANEFITHVRRLMLEIAMNSERKRQLTSAEALRNLITEYFTPEEAKLGPSFITVYEQMMKEQRATIGKEISQATYEIRMRYLNTIKRVMEELGMMNTPIEKLTPDHAEQIRVCLIKNNAVGYAGRIFTAVNMALKYAKGKGLITYNVMNETKRIKIDKSPDLFWLEPHQVEVIRKLDLTGQPLAERVRDAFVFCCFTGLSIGDYELLNPKRRGYLLKEAQSPRNIEPGRVIDLPSGQKMLMGRRRKTGTLYRIPLEAPALELIEKYGGIENLPFILYQVGPILNMICSVLKLPRTIRFHTARKTYANYLINAKKVNTHLVPEVLGWKKFEEVLPYTRVASETLAEHFK